MLERVSAHIASDRRSLSSNHREHELRSAKIVAIREKIEDAVESAVGASIAAVLAVVVVTGNIQADVD
jgi:hypothetical protein